jgi:K+-transporting ATPase ATPase A chain
MHDSFMPLSGMNQLLGMMVNCFYGGVGLVLNFYIFIILAVFISGLMVGRTPEFLGKKIEAREMKIAMIIALLHPLLILSGTAIASFLYSQNPEAFASWLNNQDITVSVKCCTNLPHQVPIMEAVLKDWETILLSGISPVELSC